MLFGAFARTRANVSYNEDANEASWLIRDEAVDRERETADRGNQRSNALSLMTGPSPHPGVIRFSRVS